MICFAGKKTLSIPRSGSLPTGADLNLIPVQVRMTWPWLFRHKITSEFRFFETLLARMLRLRWWLGFRLHSLTTSHAASSYFQFHISAFNTSVKKFSPCAALWRTPYKPSGYRSPLPSPSFPQNWFPCSSQDKLCNKKRWQKNYYFAVLWTITCI